MTHNDSNIIPFPASGAVSGILQLRVEILLMPLPVWRRFQVPGHYSFWDLHVAIQDVVGWEDKHLHQFTLDDPVPGWEHRVTRFMKPDSLPTLYTYDFGDEWQHEIILEAALPPDKSLVLPRCLEGEGRCPDEDCGGPPACVDMIDSGLSREFDPGQIIFDDPRARWDRAFGND